MAALAALALLIGGAILTMQDKKADTSNVERIIGYSALYGEESIGTAFDAVEQKFSEGFAGCTLLELRYDANVENKYADETMRYWQEHQQELLILESSFRTDETVAGSGFSPNHTYKDWQWHLVRAQDGTGWEVVDWGYSAVTRRNRRRACRRKGSRGSAASTDAVDDRSAGIC